MKLFTSILVLLFAALSGLAQTGTYTQTVPNMQSVYQATPIVFTNTPGNAASGTITCNWLGCQDVGIGNPSMNIQIFLNGNYQTLVQQSGVSMCGFVPFTYIISSSTLNSAIQSGGGSVMMRVYVQDACPSGMGCSCCNDPYINGLTLSYNYSVASFTVNDSTICPGESIQFSNTTGGTVLSKKWYFTGGTPATATNNNPTVAYNTPGVYPVSLVTTNASGTDSTIKNSYITVYAPPTASSTAAGNTTFCQGGNVVLNANTGAGLGYQWQKNNVNIAGATSSNYTAIANGTYRVVVTSSVGCTNISTGIPVTVNPKPVATISAGSVTTFCPGDSVVLSASPGSGYTFVWKKNSSTIAGVTGNTYAAKATASYKVIVTNGFGCSKTSNIIPVIVNTPVATATIQGAASVCNGNGVTLKANTGAGLSYQWKIGSTNITGATDSIYTAYTSGSYKVKVTNSCGFRTSTPQTVTIHPLPTIAISANGPIAFCTGGSVLLSSTGDVGLTYVWTKNGTAIAGATSSNYTAGATGVYAVIATNGFGCTSTSNAITVTVNNTQANITANGPTTFCVGDSVVLSANTGANLTYQWTQNNITINGATSATHSAKTAGAYRVNITNTATGCVKTSAAVQVTVNCRLGDGAQLEGVEMEISPNPFYNQTEVNIFLPETESGSLQITSVDGKVITSEMLKGGKNTMLLGQELESGVYLVRLTCGGVEKVKRIVKY
ncbi:MAG: PKD domain-containing protein [Bacteroidia bacterium]|jgi:PKD repeat protein|nr:PKD domain-containing protein [Bacteroidota bacterium]MBP6511138.1 PKD domain-containing protein [Bacteroidia bacterium]MBP7245881.1 PKD domain-containing protein [Bacteroidia bacterium]